MDCGGSMKNPQTNQSINSDPTSIVLQNETEKGGGNENSNLAEMIENLNQKLSKFKHAIWQKKEGHV